MKKIFNTLMLALVATIAFTSCNDDDVYFEDPTANQLTILSRETSFDAAPSQGSIVVDTNEPLTVTSNDQTGWISTAVEGNKVIVNVDLNGSIDGRSAMLTIKAGEKQAQVAIIQSGIIVLLDGETDVKVNDVARTIAYTLKANVPVEVYTDYDWITPVYENGELTITLSANNTGHLRTGSVVYTAGPVSDEITIRQMDFTKDVAADDYMLLYVNASNGGTYYFFAEVNKTGTAYSIDLPTIGLSMPITYATASGNTQIAAGNYLGDNGAYKVHSVLWDTEAGYLTWNSSVSMDIDWTYEEEDGEGMTLGQFKDNGSWAGYNVDALRLEAFSSMTLSSSTRLGSLCSMMTPVLVRFHELPAPSAASAADMASVAKSYVATPGAKMSARIATAIPSEFSGAINRDNVSVLE